MSALAQTPGCGFRSLPSASRRRKFGSWRGPEGLPPGSAAWTHRLSPVALGPKALVLDLGEGLGWGGGSWLGTGCGDGACRPRV